MKLEPLVAYKVTKGNTDGCIEAGDIIWKSRDGSINCEKGFLSKFDLTPEIKDFEAEIDPRYIIEERNGSEYLKTRAAIEARIRELEELLARQ